MQTPQNAFKRRLFARELQIGLWCSLGSNIAAGIVGDSGLDRVLLDTEHQECRCACRGIPEEVKGMALVAEKMLNAVNMHDFAIRRGP